VSGPPGRGCRWVAMGGAARTGRAAVIVARPIGVLPMRGGRAVRVARCAVAGAGVGAARATDLGQGGRRGQGDRSRPGWPARPGRPIPARATDLWPAMHGRVLGQAEGDSARRWRLGSGADGASHARRDYVAVPKPYRRCDVTRALHGLCRASLPCISGADPMVATVPFPPTSHTGLSTHEPRRKYLRPARECRDGITVARLSGPVGRPAALPCERGTRRDARGGRGREYQGLPLSVQPGIG